MTLRMCFLCNRRHTDTADLLSHPNGDVIRRPERPIHFLSISCEVHNIRDSPFASILCD